MFQMNQVKIDAINLFIKWVMKIKGDENKTNEIKIFSYKFWGITFITILIYYWFHHNEHYILMQVGVFYILENIVSGNILSGRNFIIEYRIKQE